MSDDSWRDEANTRIEELRKSDVQMNFVDVDATELSVEVEQVSHSFPFGQAVVSQTIADCSDDGEDDNYCTYVKDNFNWLVDTYRMKWKAIEPHQGDFAVEIADKMIAWAARQGMTVRGERMWKSARAAYHQPHCQVTLCSGTKSRTIQTGPGPSLRRTSLSLSTNTWTRLSTILMLSE